MTFFQITLKNSELKTIHNTFRDSRVHFSVDNLSRLAVYGYIFHGLNRMLMNLLITRSELSGYKAGAV